MIQSRQAHNQFDIVLDQQDRDAGITDAADSVHQVLALDGIHAGGGLVEQEQTRLGASARAISTRRCCPYGRLAAGW